MIYQHLCNQPTGNINRFRCQPMEVLFPPRFAPRDQDDNFWLRGLVSKLDIYKLGLRIYNSRHMQCRIVFITLNAYIYDFRIFNPIRNRIGGKAHAGKPL
jgi:hypothetical protein